MEDDHKTPSLPSVPRALEVLDSIAGSQSGLTLTQITRKLGYPRSTVHALLLTLERTGHVQRSGTRGPFQAGPQLLQLGSKALAGTSLRERALPVLRHLLEKTRLAVHLALLDRDQMAIIAQLAPAPSKLMTFVGQRLGWHSTALGKAVAAHLPETRLNAMIEAHALAPHNERTIVSKRRLADELAATRHRGYAIDDEEDVLGVRCLGAAVFGNDEAPVAAVSLMGTTEQITADNVDGLAAELMQSAGRISELLRTSRAQSRSVSL